MRRSLVVVLLFTLAASCGDDSGGTAEPGTTTTSTTASLVAPSTTSTTSTTGAPVTTSSEAPPDPVNVGAEAGQANLAEVQEFLSVDSEDDGPFYMINLIRYREQAEYPDGRETSLTGAEADAIYADWMRTERLPTMGAEIVYAATFEDELVAGVTFDQVAVVKYPSRAEFSAMAADPEFQAMNVHKQAGVADTVVMAARLLPTPAVPVIDTPFPATDDDPPFAFVHVFDYRETAEYEDGAADADNTRSGRDAVALYSANAGSVALPLGVRPLAFFEVEATMLGPVDKWQEVRINWFPSHAAFEALTSDAAWESGLHHRVAGLDETYAIQTLPVINAFE